MRSPRLDDAHAPQARWPGPHSAAANPRVILSFDVEEHYRIEAAAGLTISPAFQTHCRERLDVSTRWVLERLARDGVRATFFIIGKIAEHNPKLVRDIHGAGHEVASHSWDHRRVHHFTPETFREDLRRSRNALEDLTGEAVVGYRAPTFSIVRQTAWALDVLAEEGFLYDSSIYPVRHDRYGVPGAPRTPFRARGVERDMLELPPATLRMMGFVLPMGGGGTFRLFPLFLMKQAIAQLGRGCGMVSDHATVCGMVSDHATTTAMPGCGMVSDHATTPTAMLYFHPWEFDEAQKRLPLGRLSSFRTYHGIAASRDRLDNLMSEGRMFARAIDVVQDLRSRPVPPPRFDVNLADGAALTCRRGPLAQAKPAG